MRRNGEYFNNEKMMFAVREQRTICIFASMKSHNGMRPQDVVVLLKVMKMDHDWRYRDLSASLRLSLSEVSESLHRSHLAGLVDGSRRVVFRQSLMEFIRHGLKYVFPQHSGMPVTGVPTANSHVGFKGRILSELDYVWPDPEGSMRGLAVVPLYRGVPEAAREDPELHLLLAAIDMIRLGGSRESAIAIAELEKNILE
jgi:predicted transcriptional regulator